MTRCTLAILAVLAGGVPLRAEDAVAPANLDLKDGLAHWQTVLSGDEAAIAALPNAGKDGKPRIHLNSTAKHPKASAETERFPVANGKAFHVSYWSHNLGKRSNAGVFLRYFDAAGKEVNNLVNGRLPTDQDVAVVTEPTGSDWTLHEVSGIPPEGTMSGSIRLYSWQPASVDVSDFRLTAFEPRVAPPWAPSYPFSSEDTARLTPADTVGPDGRIYPDWHEAGVPGGIPHAKTVVSQQTFAGLENRDISDALQKSVASVAQAGGGAIELPPGVFYLDHSLIVDQSNVVLRGAGRDKTRLIFRDRIAYGKLRLFNWAGRDSLETGPGGTLELQANPKGLNTLSVHCENKTLADSPHSLHWGNTYSMRIIGAELLKQLGPGSHILEGKADYENGDHFTATFKVDVVAKQIDAPFSTYGSAIVFGGHGPQGERILLAEDGKRGDKQLRVQDAASLKAGDRIRLDGPTTPRWNAVVGNRCPWGTFRSNFYEIARVDGNTLALSQPLRIDFPVIDGSRIEKVSMVSGNGIEDLTLEQEMVTRDAAGSRGNTAHSPPIEDLWTNGITFSFAWGGWARNIRVVNAGRNPIYFPKTKFCEVRDSEFDNALFKGGGGTAYVGFETAFDCLMSDVSTRNLRHAPDLQWGASGNVIRNGRFIGCDAQFHAGWTHENLLEGNVVTADSEDTENGGYGYGIFSTGPSSSEHGPEGPRNVIYHNDVSSPSVGLVMLGGNEHWLVLYNRFRVGAGRAILGRETTFEHVISDNVFILEHPEVPAVYFGDPSCTGIELTNNKFYGLTGKTSGFKGGFGRLARDTGNQAFPLTPSAALPAPPVESIYLWQKEHLKPTTLDAKIPQVGVSES